jgi:hypothetical protein
MTKKLTICAVLLLSGCEVTEKSLPLDPNALTYSKDRHGICYASLSSTTSHGLKVVSITDVPCEKVRL